MPRLARSTTLSVLALVAACSGDIAEMPQQAMETLSRAGIAARPTLRPRRVPPVPHYATPAPPPLPPSAPIATATPLAAPPPTATPTKAAETASIAGGAPFAGVEKLAAARGLADFTVAISLPSLHDFSDLDRRPELKEALKLAKHYPDAPIFLAVYVTKADADQRKADAKELSDMMLVELGRFIANRGIAPERISGIGMGVDPAIGRRLVFSLDIP